ncbi:MAG: carboxyltransferase domain-containing protein [Candidatus Bathyarchaeia archaeon]
MNSAVFSEAIIDRLAGTAYRPEVVYRLAGDRYILVEYGEMKLNLEYTFRVYALDQEIKKRKINGLIETAPGVRSLLIHYDSLKLPTQELIAQLKEAEEKIPYLKELMIPSRFINLPIAIHDKWTKEAIRRYMETVRADAPNLPDNVEFVAKCNGLKGVEEVKEYISATQHLVIGLGDVYPGAPCAVPLDPRYRLVVPKYNPARMWTPEGAVGIGGAYICIYSIESPGGYQLIGRSVQIWDAEQKHPAFREAPWLLRPFDRIQFTPVTESELEEIRRQISDGIYRFKINPYEVFNVKGYFDFLDSIREEADAFRKRQQEASKDIII